MSKWSSQNLANDKQVRGIIIADEFDKRLIYASSEVPNLFLKKYKVNFTFEDIQNNAS